MKRLTKMEAVGFLCDIKNSVEGYIRSEDRTRELNRKIEAAASVKISREKYFDETILRYQKWLQALQMAGKAMTK